VEGHDGVYRVDDSEEEEVVSDPLVVGWLIAVVDCPDGGEEWKDVGED